MSSVGRARLILMYVVYNTNALRSRLSCPWVMFGKRENRPGRHFADRPLVLGLGVFTLESIIFYAMIAMIRLLPEGYSCPRDTMQNIKPSMIFSTLSAY